MTPLQCRAARAALKWSAGTLAIKAGVGVNSVSRFENESDAKLSTVTKIRSAFEGAGIEFTDGNGLRMREAS